MIDFVKVITKQPKSFLRNKHLDFTGTYNRKSGELSNKYEAFFKGLKFTYYENTFLLIIKGSLHKYHNNGLHNYNDFDYDSLLNVLNELTKEFNLKLNECYLQNIEFGLNVKLLHCVNSLLDNLVIHKNNKFKDSHVDNGNLKQAVYIQYIIKAYNKGMQYQLKENVFRFEIKVRKMQKINNLNLNTLEDLCSKDILRSFYKVLKNEWANILLFEKPINETTLKPSIKNKKLHEWQTPYYWQKLIKQNRNRQKKEFKNYIVNHTNNDFAKVNSLLENKINAILK